MKIESLGALNSGRRRNATANVTVADGVTRRAEVCSLVPQYGACFSRHTLGPRKDSR